MFRVLGLGKNGFGFAGGYVLYHFKYSAVLFQGSPLRLPVCPDLVQGFSEKRLGITTSTEPPHISNSSWESQTIRGPVKDDIISKSRSIFGGWRSSG